MTGILYVGLMRLADFHNFVNYEFGPQHGPWLLHSHVLMEYGKTPAELLEDGVEPRDIWWALCREHDIPEDRWYGPDE
ncbi:MULTISPECIES: DUF3046 domain-containing protein [Corynebacterium]|nr:DUF3046 domain-containing protein [Corynebacterium amycolatum]MBC6726836.1 DUF3046 domain-containing protein [Corynebacterium amycolatum]MBC6758167.1 DUF3046 domain-containing protein [Corynebacterium sp. LK24]